MVKRWKWCLLEDNKKMDVWIVVLPGYVLLSKMDIWFECILSLTSI